ncbi:hybrid sensor histidine kinase/response regulator [Oceanobacter mangrovi]|uniref:hybrid sensor histidine kinase/response regulator n=1 Tax=Oceanobacter mangrovi TaxID=2862510 RepID=UPI001C8D523C|nr:NahK/ErcS family hybrid sensor histidine kinase/response regulator [Oceanobacter mangrovi]
MKKPFEAGSGWPFDVTGSAGAPPRKRQAVAETKQPDSAVRQPTHYSEQQNQEDNTLVQSLIGLGAFSARKSYYPELLEKIDELEVEKERYQWLFENALHGIFQASTHDGIRNANPAMAHICGYRNATEFLRAMHSVRDDLFDVADDFDRLMEDLLDHSSIRSFETRFKRNNAQEPVPVSINVLLKDASQGLVEVFVYDITERKRAQAAMARINTELEQRVTERTRELEAAKQEAEAANLSKDKYLAAASHDLLQPMNAARLLVATLQEKQLGPDNQILVERIHTALGGAEELLGDLLDISRLDANAVTPDVEEFAVAELLQPLFSEFQPVAEQAGLELRMVGSNHRIRSDSRLLMRILRNFVSNAIRYTPSGRVLIGCRRKGDELELMVADSGPGIAEHLRAEIFREFRQLDNATKGRSKGVGLGLAIVERISRMLGHQVYVDSRVGVGSRFSVRVPRLENLPNQATEQPLKADTLPLIGNLQPRFDRARVLVIDNEESIRVSMISLLQAWGCQVITASNGEVAHEAWLSFQPDIVMADYHLDHGETGTEVIRQLRQQHPDMLYTPTVLITADRSDPVRQEIQQLGAARLNKPVKPAKLRVLMSYLLDRD